MTLKERLLAAAGYRAGAKPLRLLSGRGVPAAPRLSVVIPTRNRPASVVRTVGSVLRCDTPSHFEVIVIDQSDNDQTAIALRAFDGDDRLRHVRAGARAMAAARNEGTALARADVVAFADDGWTVPRDWLARIESAFLAHPGVGLVFGDVVPGPHDPGAGIIPAHHHRRSRVVTSLVAYAGSVGTGTCLAVRRPAFEVVGRFDEALSPGRRLPSAGDHDLAMRLLLDGWSVLETPRVSIVDHDLRSFDQLRALAERDWTAIGAAHAKLLRSDWRRVGPAVARNTLALALGAAVAALLNGRRPGGLRQQLCYWRGFARGCRVAIDASTRCFSPRRHGGRPGAGR